LGQSADVFLNAPGWSPRAFSDGVVVANYIFGIVGHGFEKYFDDRM
jgi:hypothetical protein